MTDNNTALKKAGLKVTLPRLKILEVLQEPDNHHVSAEDLYKRLIDMGEEIGLATVPDHLLFASRLTSVTPMLLIVPWDAPAASS